ncbi:hypothetical protein ACH5RR_039962 [Cinchona calisaya]|uniref:Uncharacterized protein n=1 Tax=Cinchona calisaya TaxID=153742 RepID=A0ABD2Y504_9GENT
MASSSDSQWSLTSMLSQPKKHPTPSLHQSSLSLAAEFNSRPPIPQSSPKLIKRYAQEDEGEEAFEALFCLLEEEDLKNDDLSVEDGDDDDDDISEEELAKLERELEEALKDDELLGAFDLAGDGQEKDESEEEEEEEEESGDDYTDNHHVQDLEEDADDDEEMPVKLKNWQLKKLAYALKNGWRKNNRSSKSFRRQGSSGAVWDGTLLAEMDEKGKKRDHRELRPCYSIGVSSNTSSSSSLAATKSPVYLRSSSLSVSAMKLLLPKSVGQKFKGVLGKPPSFLKPQLGKYD